MSLSTVHLFVFDTMSDWECGFLIAGINSPQFQKRPGQWRIQTVALSNKPITTMGGLGVTADMTLGELRPQDSAMLVLPGGTAWDMKQNRAAAEAAAAFLAHGSPVAAICGATAGLARVGVLDHVPHTSNSREYIAQTEYKGGAFFRSEPAVKSVNLITASAMHPLEFAREVFVALDIYSDPVLSAWYNLYKTSDAKYFTDLMQASGQNVHKDR